MPLLEFVWVLIAVGALLYVVQRYAPIDAKIKRILSTVVIIAVILWIANLFGLFGPLSHIRIGR